jgi:hypothetical protein
LKKITLAAVAASIVAVSASFGGRSGEAALGPLPAGWPTTMQIGVSDWPGNAANTAAAADFGFRYQYLAGGVNTGDGWANWNANGEFVTYYAQDSINHGITPVFTYYQIYQSNPGRSQGESAGIAQNLQNTSTMSAYYNDLKLFFQRAGAFRNNQVVLHVEPDLWGFMQQRATGDNAATVPVSVASSGMSDVNGLPNNLSGFARAIDRLRDTYAPNVVLGYHNSTWGTGNDIVLSNPSNSTIDTLATRAANFYASLQSGFDIIFAEFTDRDAGFKQYIYGDGGASWWDAGDFDRYARFLGGVSNATGKRIVLWQIPYGNTKMRAMNNTWNHYQDNKVETFFDDPARTRLNAYRDAGVVAFLFGRGADGVTCNCDANGDGVTNPAPINGNSGVSLNADDDGGFFRQKAQAYYAAGALPLAGGSPPPPPASTPTAPPPQPTPTPPGTNPPPAAGTFTATASVDQASITAGSRLAIGLSVWPTANTLALVDIEIYSASGTRVYQKFYDRQAFVAGKRRVYINMWTTPANLAPGTYYVKVGVFSPGWGTVHYWNNGAATFTVR